jgi:hypothetical protein
MIRAAALKKIPHPWFLGTPNENGRWDDGRIDDDIHWWLQAQKAGLKIGVCPRVIVGHLEAWIKWPDINMGATLQHPSDYWDRGGTPPEGAWQ